MLINLINDWEIQNDDPKIGITLKNISLDGNTPRNGRMVKIIELSKTDINSINENGTIANSVITMNTAIRNSLSLLEDNDYSGDTKFTEGSSSSTFTKAERILVDESDISIFMSLIDINCLDTGYISSAEKYFSKLCSTKGFLYGLQLMNDIYTRFPDNSLLMCSMLNILARIEYEKLGSFAVSMIIGLVALKDEDVAEYAVRAISRWGSKDFIPWLRKLQQINSDSFIFQRMIRKVLNKLTA